MALGAALGRRLAPSQVICLFGDLGAGKTTFVQGVAQGLCESEPLCDIQVVSPTYVYLNIYEGTTPLYHFDLYRFKTAYEFLEMGFDEYLYASGVCCIEWPERIASLLQEPYIKVTLTHQRENTRQIAIEFK